MCEQWPRCSNTSNEHTHTHKMQSQTKFIDRCRKAPGDARLSNSKEQGVSCQAAGDPPNQSPDARQGTDGQCLKRWPPKAKMLGNCRRHLSHNKCCSLSGGGTAAFLLETADGPPCMFAVLATRGVSMHSQQRRPALTALAGPRLAAATPQPRLPGPQLAPQHSHTVQLNNHSAATAIDPLLVLNNQVSQSTQHLGLCLCKADLSSNSKASAAPMTGCCCCCYSPCLIIPAATTADYCLLISTSTSILDCCCVSRRCASQPGDAC